MESISPAQQLRTNIVEPIHEQQPFSLTEDDIVILLLWESTKESGEAMSRSTG